MQREKRILVKKKCKVCGSKMIVPRKHRNENQYLVCEDCKRLVTK